MFEIYVLAQKCCKNREQEPSKISASFKPSSGIGYSRSDPDVYLSKTSNPAARLTSSIKILNLESVKKYWKSGLEIKI